MIGNVCIVKIFIQMTNEIISQPIGLHVMDVIRKCTSPAFHVSTE